MKIRVSNGKYTFIKESRVIHILRYDTFWHTQTEAYNALTSIMAELDAARVVIEAARNLGENAPIEIKNSLEKHRDLVDDNESPSDWCLSKTFEV